VGQGGQAAHVLIRQAELGPGDRQSPGPATDGDDHPISGPHTAIGYSDGVGVDEPRVAGLFDEIDSGGTDVIGKPLTFIQIIGHPLGVGERSSEVDLGPRPV
jgi:hypothetical protein